MFEIFKRFSPMKFSYNGDHTALWLNVVGGLLIAVSFILIGTYIVFATPSSGASRNRIRVGKMFGWFIISCGLSRAIDATCLWENIAILSGYAKILTGTIAFITLTYIPSLIKEANIHTTLEKVKAEMQKTKENIEEVKELGNKLDKDNASTTN